MSEVVFRDVPGFPGYRVGDDGSVWSCWRPKSMGYRQGCKRAIDPGAWRPLVPCIDKRGRLSVQLCRDGKARRAFVHRLVLLAFVGPCPEGMEACHFPDPSLANCRLDNLRWDTKAGNMADKVAHGTAPKGEQNPRAVLTAEQVVAIRKREAAGEKRKDLAAEHGVARTTIDAAVNGETWADVPAGA